MNTPTLTDSTVQSVGSAAIGTARTEIFDVLVSRGFASPQQASMITSSICRRSLEAFEAVKAGDFQS